MAEHVCPVWAGYFLANRLRKWLHNPDRIVGPYVAPGMTVLDFGSAMGFFSLPMAETVGPGGKVVCVDLQSGMLDALRRRAARAGLADRIETQVSTENSTGLRDCENRFDFALAFTVLHEVRGRQAVIEEIASMLKPGASFLVTEPIKHVSPDEFERTLAEAEAAGLSVTERPRICLSQSALLIKPKGNL